MKKWNPVEPLTVLAGAGISMNSPSNLSSARQIMDVILEYGANSSENFQILQSIPDLRYEFIVQAFRNFFDNQLQFLDYFIQDFAPNHIHYILGHLMFNNAEVFTTNFDCLIENALNIVNHSDIQNQSSFNKILHSIITRSEFENLLQNLKNHPNYHLENKNLIKLHGSPLNYFSKENTKSTVITTLDMLSTEKEKSQDIFSLPIFKQKLLHELSSNRTLLVIGYSGGDSFDIMPEIETMKNLKRIIWVDHLHQATVPNQMMFTQYHNEEIQQDQGSPLDNFLLRMKKLKEIEVTKIQGSSLSVLKLLFPESFQLTENLINLNENNSAKNLHDWFMSTFSAPAELYKIWFTADIFHNYHYPKNALTLYQQLIEQMKDNSEMQGQYGSILGSLGLIYDNLGDLENAFEFYKESFLVAQKIGDGFRMMMRLNDVGTIFKKTGQYDQAIKFFTDAYNIAKEHNEEESMAMFLNNLGQVYQIVEGPQKALTFYEESLALDKKLGNLSSIATDLNNIGMVYRLIGNFDEAGKFYQDAYKIMEELGDYYSMAKNISNQGQILRLQGNLEQANSHFLKALKIEKKVNDQHGMAIELNNLGAICQAQKKYEQAIEYFEQSLNYFTKIDDKRSMGIISDNIGGIYYNWNKYTEALQYYEKAHDLFKILQDKLGIANNYNNQAVLYEKIEKYSIAIDYAEKAHAIYVELEQPQRNSLAEWIERLKSHHSR